MRLCSRKVFYGAFTPPIKRSKKQDVKSEVMPNEIGMTGLKGEKYECGDVSPPGLMATSKLPAPSGYPGQKDEKGEKGESGEWPLVKVLPHAQRCANEFNVNNAILNDFVNEGSLMPLFTAEKQYDRNVKCMVKCMLEKENYFKDRKINIQSAVLNTPRGSTVDVRKCITIDDNDECEMVFKSIKCMVEEFAKINN